MNLSKKQRIFDLAVQSLKRISNLPEGYYICPLCLQGFKNSNSLTIEHAPPRSIAGSGMVLTCSQCNNYYGSKIDSNVAGRRTFHQKIIDKENPSRYYLELNGEKLSVNITMGEKQVKIEVIPNRNDPKVVNKISNEFTSNSKFKVTSQFSYNERYARIGDLKSAYLIAFAYFGYSYILNPKLNKVREQIIFFDDEIIKNFMFYKNESINECEVIKINDPFSYLWVRFEKSNVILPWIDSEEELYDKVFANIDSGIQVSGEKYDSVSHPLFLLDCKGGVKINFESA